MPTHHLAQLNIGRMLGPIDSETMAGFVAKLDEINALAESTPGFVWRLKTEDGDATAIRPYEDDRIIVNMSVWESAEALHDYVYRSAHVDVMRQRREWFARMAESFMVLWWVPAGHRPSVAEAVARLATLRADGPSPEAFTFRERFPAPDATPDSIADRSELAGECPAL
jgi:Domain of unknown function (DUF3291)